VVVCVVGVVLGGGGPLEHDALAGVVTEEHLRRAGSNEEQRVAGVSVFEYHLTGGDAHQLELAREARSLLVVEQLEERYFGEQSGVRRHGLPSSGELLLTTSSAPVDLNGP
jgi:hypothetical protein